MFSSSDFNDAVPQFSNGSYASNPLDPLYIEEPSQDDYNQGVEPLQTLPAQWWNWLINQFTGKLNKVNIYVKNIFNELTELLSLVGVTPDATEEAVTTGQLKDAFETKYPNYISKFIHTLAELWSYTGTVVVGDVTTTQTSRLAIFEHVNTSDASTDPTTETDEYNTKYIDKLPIELGGTNADNELKALTNLCSTIPTSSSMTTANEVIYKDGDDIKKSTVSVLSDVITQSQDPTIVKSKKCRWLRFDFSDSTNKSIRIIEDVRISYPSGTFKSGSEGFTKNMQADMVTSAGANYNGTDFFVYVVPSDNTYGGDIVCSKLSTAPTDIDAEYTSDKVLKIGRFSTICVNVGSPTMILPDSPSSGKTTSDTILVKPYTESNDSDFYAFYNKQIIAVSTGTYYDVITVSHPLAGFEAGDIIPESVWCLTFMPKTRFEDAMVYDVTTDKAIDVYLQMGTGENTRSMYSTGNKPTNSRQQINHYADMLTVGKQLLSDEEFTSAALGSNERTNISGSASVNSSGGHSDTASRRMISAIGCEDCCGFLWQWLRDVGPVGGSSFTTVDGQASFGQSYGTPYGLLAGGGWGSGSSCGSRCRAAAHAVSYVIGTLGGRGSSPVIREL